LVPSCTVSEIRWFIGRKIVKIGNWQFLSTPVSIFYHPSEVCEGNTEELEVGEGKSEVLDLRKGKKEVLVVWDLSEGKTELWYWYSSSRMR